MQDSAFFILKQIPVHKIQSLINYVTFCHQKLPGFGKSNVPNTADFMASYTVFHVSGCIKLEFTFLNVFSCKWALI